jgi:uncharacterized damage-inducible protein DinB
MKAQDVKLIFDYNYWANKNLLASAAKLSQEQFVGPADFPHGSLLGTLLQTLDAGRAGGYYAKKVSKLKIWAKLIFQRSRH